MGAGDGADNSVYLLGINLSTKPRWVQFLVPTLGFLVGYLVNGIAEEYVFNELRLGYGWYFTFIQVITYVALVSMHGFAPRHMVNSWGSYVKLSAVLMASLGLTKGSLEWLNYPAQIMFKSTKVLPVMLMGAFIPGLRRTYGLIEYFSAVMLVIGLIIFTLADAQTSPIFGIWGVIMVCGALIMDAFMGNLQEAIFKVNPATTQTEMLYCTSIVGAPLLLIPMLATGEVFAAWNACIEHPYVYAVLVFENICTYIGQLSVLCLITLFGAANTAMITTARKAFTLLLSYLIFTKPFTGKHICGLMLISVGILLKLLPDPCPNIRPGAALSKSFSSIIARMGPVVSPAQGSRDSKDAKSLAYSKVPAADDDELRLEGDLLEDSEKNDKGKQITV